MSAPHGIVNPPGLSTIRYRCGTFTSFRQAMLNRVANPDLLESAVTSLGTDAQPADTQISVTDAVNFPISEPFRIKIGGEYLTVVSGAGTLSWKVLRGSSPSLHTQGDSVSLDPENPFARWHEGIDSDYHTMFVELWAYLGDVLTFYQERIANEAFLATATQRDSLLRLAGLIGYRPSPGAGASGLVAFSAAKGQTVTIPAGFRVGSQALPGKPAVTYETSAAVTATADNSLIAMAAKSSHIDYDAGSIVIRGTRGKLEKNDYLLAVENEGPGNEIPHLLRIDAVMRDSARDSTILQWHDVEGLYQQATKDISLYSFSVKAAPMGHIAPRWEFLSPVLNNFNGQFSAALYRGASWDLRRLRDFRGIEFENPWFYIPAPFENPDPTVLQLDSTYDQLKYSSDHRGWAVLLADGSPPKVQALRVSDSRPTGTSAYSLSSKSTRLTFQQSIHPNTFPFRTTQVLTGEERLELEVYLPLPETLSGNILRLAGIHTQLQAGQIVVVQGALARDGTAAAELAIISDPVVTDSFDNVTLVQLKDPLSDVYTRLACSLLANVVEVTQGETVKDEVLGSGNAAPFQSFPLAQKPLNYLPSTDSEGLSAVQSSLTVSVNGVAWIERRSLATSGPQSQEFATTLDDSGLTTVVFGDGFNGARPPNGANNVHARYRKGLGSSGNLPRGSIHQLVDSTPNLQKVTNPIASSGGSDPESPAQIRRNASSSLRTFSRAVNVADYAALAQSYPGIAKASAAWIVADPDTGQPVSHPYVQLTAVTLDRTPLQGSVLASNLRRFLDNHRDPNVRLRIQDFKPVYLQVAVSVEIDDRFPHQATLNRVRAALNPAVNPDGTQGFFAFERLQFGQTVYLSELYAAMQSIEGVKDSNVTTLLRRGEAFAYALASAPHDICTGSTEIAAIDPVASPGSSLTITALGGFADQ